jgi:hypothetical protein
MVEYGKWYLMVPYNKCGGENNPKKKKKHFQLSLFSLLISQKHDEKDSFYESVDKLKTLLTNVK